MAKNKIIQTKIEKSTSLILNEREKTKQVKMVRMSTTHDSHDHVGQIKMRMNDIYMAKQNTYAFAYVTVGLLMPVSRLSQRAKGQSFIFI